MANDRSSLHALCACFRGEVPTHADWTALISLANETLTTSALIGFVRSQRRGIPADVVAYVEQLHARNVVRNDRLLAQLEEALLALNRVGITPALIKGTATIATSTHSDRGLRLMSDLDLLVRPDQIDAAMTGLAAIGYRTDFIPDGQGSKWYADLSRPHDVGMIDLHDAFPADTFLDQTATQIALQLRPIQIGPAQALVPSPELQAAVLLAHDQFQDYDYWTARIDLRHLLDLKALLTAPGGLCLDTLAAIAPGALARNALEAQFLILARLLGVPWPVEQPPRLVPRLQVWRQLMQARYPALRLPLLPLAVVELRNYRTRPRRNDRSNARPQPGWLPVARQWKLPRLKSLLFLARILTHHRAGKL